MSVSAITEPAEADRARSSHALAFRIAFAAAAGLTLGESLGWDFPFLPAMLAVQLLSGREPFSIKKGVAFVAVMAAACVFAAGEVEAQTTPKKPGAGGTNHPNPAAQPKNPDGTPINKDEANLARIRSVISVSSVAN